MKDSSEIAIIGAGPAGVIAAALLKQLGHSVTVIEQSHFPRFSIGESLLPQCMEFIEIAGMTAAIENAGFQFKDGAVFSRNGIKSSFDFTKKFSPGRGTTFQVQRAKFDKILADCATQQGIDIRYGEKIFDITPHPSGQSTLSIQKGEGSNYTLEAEFILDASGFGRVLSRLLKLEAPSNFPVRRSIFTHIEDNISDPGYDRTKILITIHPERSDVWYWLIPFQDGRASIGVVAENKYFEELGSPEDENKRILESAIASSPELSSLLQNSIFDSEVQSVVGYSSNVTSLYGNGFALLGNAGEFLDPVFSSGVTIAMKSAVLAAPLVSAQLNGKSVNWEQEYSEPLKQGVDTFRAYVDAWYEGTFQHIIFSQNQNPSIRDMVSSILAGYAWDTKNPFVKDPSRRLNMLYDLCEKS